MRKNLDGNDSSATRLLLIAKFTFFVVIACAFVITLIYVGNFKDFPKAQTTDVWGQVGDFFGGVLNPIIGIATIYLVLISILIQRRELDLTRIEMQATSEALTKQGDIAKLQVFEQTFFSWLSNYKELVNAISITSKTFADEENIHAYSTVFSAPLSRDSRPLAFVQLSGLTALAKMWRYSDSQKYFEGEIGNETLDPDNLISEIQKIDGDMYLSEQDKTSQITYKLVLLEEKLQEEWDMFYKKNGFQVDSPLRTLFGLISWIDNHNQVTKKDKWHYVEIILAHLSQLEIHLLYFYGRYHRNDTHRKLYENFALLREIDTTDLIVKCIDMYRELSPNVYNWSVFDPISAKNNYLNDD